MKKIQQKTLKNICSLHRSVTIQFGMKEKRAGHNRGTAALVRDVFTSGKKYVWGFGESFRFDRNVIFVFSACFIANIQLTSV